METVFRQCALTGENLPEHLLIRLVRSPQGKWVADLNAELPGEDLWLCGTQSSIEKAISQGLLAKGEADGLPQAITRLMRRKCLDFLGLAKRKGGVLSGYSKAKKSIEAGEAMLLLLPGDGAEYQGKDDLTRLDKEVEIVGCFGLSELQSALSSGNSVHVVLKSTSMAAKCKGAIARLLRYEERIGFDDERQ